ncbi:MAG: DUF3841 domain-containing protein [Bacilli bacterium]|nr:DUF3841 domain-containing protein [Bacilli bacterium]
MKKILYSYQRKEAVNILKRNGVLFVPQEMKDKTHLGTWKAGEFAYRFLMSEMKDRLPKPAHEQAYFPIWAWHTVEGKAPPTESLDEIHHGNIRLKIELEEERFLLSDFDMFAAIFAGSRYFKNVKGAYEKYEKHYYDVPDEFFYPNLREMFTLHRPKNTYYAFSYKKETIQATFFELYLEDVLEFKEV